MPGPAPEMISCGGCARQPSQVPKWNQYKIYYKGTPQEVRMPVSDACGCCALVVKHGDLGWPETKERAAADPEWRVKLQAAGDLAYAVSLQEEAKNSVNYGDLGRETVSVDDIANVTMRSWGKLVSPEDFKTAHDGVAHTEAGLSMTTLTNQFGSRCGILIEDRSREPEIMIDTTHQVRLSDIRLNPTWHIRPNQGHEVMQKVAKSSPIVPYAAQALQELLRNLAASKMASAPPSLEAAEADESGAASVEEAMVSLDDPVDPVEPPNKRRRGAARGGGRRGGRGHLRAQEHLGAIDAPGAAPGTPASMLGPAPISAASRSNPGTPQMRFDTTPSPSPRASPGSGSAVHNMKGSTVGPGEEYVKKLSHIYDILADEYKSYDKEGNAKTVAQDIYQASRVRNSLFNKDGTVCSNPGLAAKLKRAMDVATVAKEVQKDRIAHLSHKALRDNFKVLLPLVKHLPVVTLVELWLKEIRRCVLERDDTALSLALRMHFDDGEAQKPTSELVGLRHLLAVTESPSALASKVVQPALIDNVVLVVAGFVTTQDECKGADVCEKFVKVILETFDNNTSPMGMAMAEFLSILRGVGGC